MKTRFNTLYRLVLSLSSTLLITNPVWAQTDDKPVTGFQGWYQVEMIVFSRKNPAIQEHFPNNIQLHYPARWQSLKDPYVITSIPENTVEPATPTTLAPTIPAPSINVDFNTQAFYQLPAEMRQLNLQADKLSRSIDYQVLFHQAWRQQVSSKNLSDWILIHNTNSIAPAPKLAGAVRLSVTGYLRLDTNLWLAEFEPRNEMLENSEEMTNAEEIESPWPELPENPEAITQDITLGSENTAGMQNTTETQNDFSNAVSDSIDQTATEAWQTKRIVLLKEKRDMRSNEVNYVDHPILGIIIKVTPFKPAVVQ